MEIKIEGDPGTGNSFIEVYAIINNNYGTRVKPHFSQDTTEVDKEQIRPKIISYVKKTIDKVSPDWKNKFEALWQDILNLNEVDIMVYNPGEQMGTDFNRVLVAGIIHVLMDAKVYVKCTYTSLAILLENNEDHHVRQELGKYPSEEIQTVVKQLLKNKYL